MAGIPTARRRFPRGPAARVRRVAVQNLASGTPVAMGNYDQVDYSQGGLWDGAAPKRLTATERGLYVITASVTYAPGGGPGAGTYRTATLRINAANYQFAQIPPIASATIGTVVVIAAQALLAIGDFVDLMGWHDAAAALDCTASLAISKSL